MNISFVTVLRLIFLILCLFIFSSCGSIIKSNTDIIVVDSLARGYQVSDEGKNIIGSTPFLYQVEKKRISQFYLLKENLAESFSYKCSYDFSESVLPNALTSFIAWPIGIVAFGIDWYNGSIYKCKESIFISNLPAIEATQKDVEFLILPASVNSFTASNILSEKFIEINQQPNMPIHFNRLDEELAEVGIGPYSINNLEKINFELLNPLLLQKKITHLVYFNISEKDGIYKASPVVVDIFSKKIIMSQLKTVEIKYDNVSYMNLLVEKFHIIPNSIKLSETKYTDTEDYLKTNRHPKAFPKLLTSISIGTVYNPAKYSTWDFDYYSSPNFSMPSWKWTYNSQSYFFQSIIATLNGGLLFKTPFGAISGEIGFGGLYFHEKPSSVKKDLHTCINLNVSYVFYFSKKLFFHATTQIYSPSGVKFNNKEASLQQGYVGIGYFFPTLDFIVQEKLLN